MARVKDDEGAVRRELMDIFRRTGNERYRNAAEQLHEGNLFDELIALSKGKGAPEKKDNAALMQMGRLIVDGRAKGSRQAAQIVADDIATPHTQRESVVRRLQRKFDKGPKAYLGFARMVRQLQADLQRQQQFAQEIQTGLALERMVAQKFVELFVEK